MAPHSSTLAWKIPWMEEPGRLQSMGSLESDMTERLNVHFSLSCTGEGNGSPLQCSCLENPRDGGPWWAAVYGVAQSQTRLKQLSSSKGNIFEGSVQFSRSVMSYSLRSHEPQHAGLSVYHQLPEFTQTHVHYVGDAVQPSHPLSSPSPPALSLSQHQGLFK